MAAQRFSILTGGYEDDTGYRPRPVVKPSGLAQSITDAVEAEVSRRLSEHIASLPVQRPVRTLAPTQTATAEPPRQLRNIDIVPLRGGDGLIRRFVLKSEGQQNIEMDVRRGGDGRVQRLVERD